VFLTWEGICFQPHQSGDRPSASDLIAAGNLRVDFINSYSAAR